MLAARPVYLPLDVIEEKPGCCDSSPALACSFRCQAGYCFPITIPAGSISRRRLSSTAVGGLVASM